MKNELKVSVKRKDKSILMVFDKPILWVKLSGEEARNLSAALIKKVRDIDIMEMAKQ